MGNLNCSWFSAWPGIRILDYFNDLTYLLFQSAYQDGEKRFESKPGIIHEWSLDKYFSRANWYGFKEQYPKEIFDEFHNLGFLFDNISWGVRNLLEKEIFI